MDVPEGELVPRETMAINEVGMAVEWEGMWKKRVGSKQETLMKYEGLSMAAWFLPSTTFPPFPELYLPEGHREGRWVTLERKDCKSHAE